MILFVPCRWMTGVRRRVWSVGCSVAGLICMLSAALHAAEKLPVVIEAESVKGPNGKVYRDSSASGGRCVVLPLGESVKTPVLYKGDHPAGDYVLTVWLDAQPLATLHGLKADITAGGVTRTVRPAEFDGTTARLADAGKLVQAQVGRGPKDVTPWFNQTVWLRRLPGGRKQVLVNLLNPPGYAAFLNRVQPPSSTLFDVVVSLPVPRGTKMTRALHVSPDLLEGELALPLSIDGGRASVSLPELKKWSVVVFEFEPVGAVALPNPLFKLTTPVEDARAELARRAEEVAKEQEAKLAEGGMSKAAAKQERASFHRDFKRVFNADEEAAKKLAVLDDPKVRRNGTLDVLHCKGVFSWLNPVESAVGLAGGGEFESAWESYAYWRHSDSGAAEDFPETLAELLRFDVVVLDNYHARTLDPKRRAMIAHYVRNGGGLVIFGGVDNFSMGMDRNSALAELEPVEVVSRENLARDDKGMPLTPVVQGFFKGADWAKAPQVYCMDISPLRPGVEVLARAGVAVS